MITAVSPLGSVAEALRVYMIWSIVLLLPRVLPPAVGARCVSD